MDTNPYDNPEFARNYALAQVNRSKNLYEFNVTHPATLQLLDSTTERVLDYGCGAGIFTAGIAKAGRASINSNLEVTGVDASEEMLKYASIVGGRQEGLRFEKWDATTEESSFQRGEFQRIFAKLVLNYVSGGELKERVMPRLREALSDDGLLIVVLPNPLREASYSKRIYTDKNELSIDVGSFKLGENVQSYHHTYESLFDAASGAGFSYGKVLGLPDVRFERYRRKLMPIAHPMPMILDTLNAAKRWVYVFGASESSFGAFDSAVERFESWRSYYYPEIADRVHFRTKNAVNDDMTIPFDVQRETLYDYDGHGGTVIALEGSYAEKLTPRQKVRLSRKLARLGLREVIDIDELLVNSAA